jgi:hypothetical protein
LGRKLLLFKTPTRFLFVLAQRFVVSGIWASGRSTPRRSGIDYHEQQWPCSLQYNSTVLASEQSTTTPAQSMKTNTPCILMAIAATAAALLFTACASMTSANTESLLSAAGFVVRTPQTPQQQQIYAALPPYQVQRATVKGKGVFYVYKDEKAGVAYVGREQEYQRYQQLAIQQQITQDQITAAEMERAAAWQWYGAWGPRAFWW